MRRSILVLFVSMPTLKSADSCPRPFGNYDIPRSDAEVKAMSTLCAAGTKRISTASRQQACSAGSQRRYGEETVAVGRDEFVTRPKPREMKVFSTSRKYESARRAGRDYSGGE